MCDYAPGPTDDKRYGAVTFTSAHLCVCSVVSVRHSVFVRWNQQIYKTVMTERGELTTAFIVDHWRWVILFWVDTAVGSPDPGSCSMPSGSVSEPKERVDTGKGRNIRKKVTWCLVSWALCLNSYLKAECVTTPCVHMFPPSISNHNLK